MPSDKVYYGKSVQGGDRVLDRRECAKYLEVSVSSIDRLLRAKLIPHSKICGKPLFSQHRLDEWLLSREELPVDWQDECFQKQLTEAVEAKERSTRLKRLKELRPLLLKINAEDGDKEFLDSLTQPERILREEVSISLFNEFFDLQNQEEAQHRIEMERLKNMFNINIKDNND